MTEYWWWHSRVKLWDGDALYYVAAALKFAGHSTDEALRQTGVFFHQEDTVDRIRGTLTGVAGQPGAGAHNLEAPASSTRSWPCPSSGSSAPRASGSCRCCARWGSSTSRCAF
ncbi:hypothetical protein ACFQ9X_41085 [Catenulispora yoronensis]